MLRLRKMNCASNKDLASDWVPTKRLHFNDLGEERVSPLWGANLVSVYSGLCIRRIVT